MTANQNDQDGRISTDPRYRSVLRFLWFMAFVVGFPAIAIFLVGYFEKTAPVGVAYLGVLFGCATIAIWFPGLWMFRNYIREEFRRYREHRNRVHSIMILPPLLFFLCNSSLIAQEGALEAAWTGTIDWSACEVHHVYADTGNAPLSLTSVSDTDDVHVIDIDGAKILSDGEGRAFLVTTNGESFRFLLAEDVDNIVIQSTACDKTIYHVTSASPDLVCPPCLIAIVIVVGAILIGIVGYKVYKCLGRAVSNHNYNLTNTLQKMESYSGPPSYIVSTFGSGAAAMASGARLSAHEGTGMKLTVPSGYTFLTTNTDYQQVYRDLSNWTPLVATNWAGNKISYQSAIAIGPGNLLASNSVSVEPARLMSSLDMVNWTEESEPLVIVETVGVGVDGLPASSTVVSYMYGRAVGSEYSYLNADGTVRATVYSWTSVPIDPKADRKFWKIMIGAALR